jgi:MinD superfamily P-loop ATPase
MKQLVILSGKGGTGKTTVTAALAHLASQGRAIVMADADVDAANLELVLDPTKLEAQDFRGGKAAVIDGAACTACGICAEVCRFGAAVPSDGVYQVNDLACEGCAACYYQCPSQAIHMEEQRDGQWFRSDTRFGPLLHAHLFAGQENSGKLVTMVKQQARQQALNTDAALVLVDGPPGIGCPVIAACSGADLALHVVEPTISGVHDLERIMATTDHFGVPSLVVVNKADLNPGRAEEISDYCAERGVEVVGRIPYDTLVTEAMVHGRPVTEYTNGPVAATLTRVWARVRHALLFG